MRARLRLSAAAKEDVVTDRVLDAPASGCTAISRSDQHYHVRPPERLGAAEIDLRTLVTVPGGSGGRLADGAELRLAAMPNDPIGLVHEGGQWLIAEHR